MEEIKLTPEQAYLSTFAFLEGIYRVTRSNELGTLLGSMLLRAEGGTADPAIAGEWEQAMRQAISGSVDARFER
ncbi:hypothetical protein [Botrimarina colliarenosi]|uniref:hypothetical protein n=1 Tax=Botrimarina colliarenosi TaxID=2528001 RepID=UPI0018D2959F|nr:hypothetical protein [Botrimarina colliarenosi]